MKIAVVVVVVGVVGVLAVGGWSAGCVVPESNIGLECEESSVCGTELGCVLLDEDDLDSQGVCMPLRNVGAPTACTVADDCLKAGLPVDSDCADGACICQGDAFTCDTEGTFNADACTCDG